MRGENENAERKCVTRTVVDELGTERERPREAERKRKIRNVRDSDRSATENSMRYRFIEKAPLNVTITNVFAESSCQATPFRNK